MVAHKRHHTEEADLDEEVRVTYVGSTRARNELLVGRGYAGYGFRSLEHNGRVFCKKSQDKAQVELGLPGDVDEFSCVSKTRFSGEEIRAGQAYLAAHKGENVRLEVVAAEDHIYVVRTLDGIALGALTQSVNKDLFKIAEQIDTTTKRKPPNKLFHVTLSGVRTFAVTDDNPRIAELCEPWATTGIFLVPVIRALTMIWFPSRGPRPK